MPADVIERINVLARARPAGLNFTNMRNEEYAEEGYGSEDSGGDSDDDSEYNSDDESSEGDDDDDDDDFIPGVD